MENLMPELSDDEIRYYRHVHTLGNGIHEPRWRGTRVVKYPSDLLLYAEVIWKRKPDYIIETGTHFGGSALFLADILFLTHAKPSEENPRKWEVPEGKKVISVDVSHSLEPPPHPMVEHILGSSTDPAIVERIRQEVAGSRVMVTLDSDHSTKHVLAELEAYKGIVTRGQYMVVEDSWTRHKHPYKPYHAVEKFLKVHGNFRRNNIEKKFVFAVTKDGWLLRRR